MLTVQARDLPCWRLRYLQVPSCQHRYLYFTPLGALTTSIICKKGPSEHFARCRKSFLQIQHFQAPITPDPIPVVWGYLLHALVTEARSAPWPLSMPKSLLPSMRPKAQRWEAHTCRLEPNVSPYPSNPSAPSLVVCNFQIPHPPPCVE